MELVKFNQAYQALMVAKNIDEVKQIRDQAEALRLYLKQQGESLEMQNACAEIKLRAERRAGEILREMPKATGGQPYQNGKPTNTTMVLVENVPTLKELGIDPHQSSRFQSIASIPESIFEAQIAETKAKKEELTTKQLLAVAKQEIARQHIPEPAITPPLPTGKYRCIVIDPPWPMKKIEKVSISQNNSTEQRDYIILKLARCHLEPGWSVTRQAELFNRYGIFTAESWDSLTDEQLKTMAVEISG